MNKINTLQIIYFIEDEFNKYGIKHISQESYEILYHFILMNSV